MIAGRWGDPAYSPFPQAADRVVAADFTVPAGNLVKVTALVDGGGPGFGAQSVRALAYVPGGALVAVSSDVVITDGQPVEWVDLPMPSSAWEGGSLRVALQWGGPTNASRAYGLAGLGLNWADTFADGPAASCPAAPAAAEGLAMFATVTPVIAWHDMTDEEAIGMPFGVAQSLLKGVPTGESYRASCEWHGTATDPHRGAVALVNEDGPLADLVGERVRVTAGKQSLLAYVYAGELLDDDLSLPRDAFMRLGLLSADSIPVLVEVVG